MALLDRARSLTTDRPAGATLGRAAGPGLVSGALSWLAVLVIIATGWGMTPQGTTSFGDVLGVASAAWFVGLGGSVSVDGVTVGVVPIGLWLVAIWLTSRGWARVRHTSDRAVAADAREFLLGYAAWVVLAALLTFLAPPRPTLSSFVVLWLVPLIAIAVDVARHPEELDPESRLVTAWQRLPEWARRAGRPAAAGAIGLVLAGTMPLLVTAILRWETVTDVAAGIAPSSLGAVSLAVAQLAYVPTLVIWALSVVAGPGVHIGTGASVTLAGSHPGLLPMVPVLGLVPGDAAYSWVAWLMVALPVAAGVAVGRATCAQWTRPARWQDKARTAAVACGALAVAVGILGALATGPLGADRLGQLGVPAVRLAAAVGVELAIGAAGWLAGEALLRRRAA
ncbi:MAG: DUF6350 family protein [Dermatophilaceae bacterium]